MVIVDPLTETSSTWNASLLSSNSVVYDDIVPSQLSVEGMRFEAELVLA